MRVAIALQIIKPIFSLEDIQEAGEDLSAEMGKVLEAKNLLANLKQRLENLL